MLEWPRNETIRVWYYLADGQMLGRQLAIQLSVIWLDTLLSLRRTPLHWATVCENPEVIRALLANGGTYTHSSCIHTMPEKLNQYFKSGTTVWKVMKLQKHNYV